jgi:hypothetical protein
MAIRKYLQLRLQPLGQTVLRKTACSLCLALTDHFDPSTKLVRENKYWAWLITDYLLLEEDLWTTSWDEDSWAGCKDP